YALALDAELAGAEDPANRWRAEGAAGHLRAEGRGDRRRFDLALVDVAVLDGSLEGSGRFGWEPSLAAAMDVEFTRLDPGLLVPEWNGRIDGSIEADAAVADDGLAADIERLEVAGTLRGRPIDLSGRGRYEAPN